MASFLRMDRPTLAKKPTTLRRIGLKLARIRPNPSQIWQNKGRHRSKAPPKLAESSPNWPDFGKLRSISSVVLQTSGRLRSKAP